MKYPLKTLYLAGAEGAHQAAEALEQLTGESIEIQTLRVDVKNFDEFIDTAEFSPVSFLISSQTVRGKKPGFVLMVLKEHEARRFVKLLSGEDSTLASLQKKLTSREYDTIMEVLNILGNSYINALSKTLKTKTIILNSPEIIKGIQLYETLMLLSERPDIKFGNVIVFEAVLFINKQEIRARLLLLFDEKLLT